MKTVDISDATESLSHYARSSHKEPVLVTRNGKPYAALVPVGPRADLENLAIAGHPKFIEIMDRSEKRWREEGGLSSLQVREQLGIKRRPARRKSR